MSILLLLIVLFIITLLIVFFLVVKRWKISIVLLACFLLLNYFTQTIPLNLSFYNSKLTGDFSVETYNIHAASSNFYENLDGIIDQIIQTSPTFLFLTECSDVSSNLLDSVLFNNQFVFFANAPNSVNNRFFSKWPIDKIENLKVDTALSKVNHMFKKVPTLREHLRTSWIYRVQIHKDYDTLAIYSCHLGSNDYVSFKNGDNDIGDAFLSNVKRLELGYKIRKIESDMLYKHLKKEKYPALVIGDMNDVSGAYSINRICSAGFKDAWWNKGFGYGTTYHGHGMKLRIDHILYNKGLALNKVRVIDSDLSDHNAIVALFDIKTH